MRSAFVFDPGLIPLKLREGFNVIHVSCIPYLCGMPLPDRVRGAKDAFPKILLSLPFISRGNAFKAFAENFPRFAACFDGFTLQNIGDLDLLSELIGKTPGVSREDLFLAGDISLNVANPGSAAFFAGRLDSLAILPEVPENAALELAAEFPEGLVPEIIASGQGIVMRTEYCPAVRNSSFKCGKCGPFGLLAGSLFNEAGDEFKIVTDPLDCSAVLIGGYKKSLNYSPDVIYSQAKYFWRFV